MLTFHLWFNILLIGGPIEKLHKYEEKFQNKIFYKKNDLQYHCILLICVRISLSSYISTTIE